MKKNVLLVMLSMLFAAVAANAVVIVDDDLEGAGDAVADFAGEIVTPWAGCSSHSWTYWRIDTEFDDEEPGVGIDGDALPLEVKTGDVISKFHGGAPQTATVTYAGTVEHGVYTLRMQVGHFNAHGPIQAADMEITLGGMMPTSVDAPTLGGDNDVVWTFVYEAMAGDVGQPLTFKIHIPTTFTGNTTFLFDHVEIDLDAAVVASNPSPYDQQGIIDDNLVSGSDSIVLSWTKGLAQDSTDPNLLLPNPDVTGYYVYVNDDPNMADVTPISVTNTNTTISPVGYNQLKYWRVDQVINNAPLGDPINIEGVVWSFASESAFPEVDAGPDLYASLELAQSGLTLNGSYSDADGTAITSSWELLTFDISYPGGVQSFGDAASPVTTFTTDTAGRFLAKLSVADPDYPGEEYSDTIEILIVEDACVASKGSPDGYTQNAYDFNNDCHVNLQDFAMLASNWLVATIFDTTVEY